MRRTRVYHPGQYVVGSDLALSVTSSQHVGVVLRMRVGEALTLFSGEDVEAQATISAIERKLVRVNIDAVYMVSRESPFSIHLVQALSRSDRMDMVVQKAVELGVYSITPIISEYCSVKLNAEQKLKKLLHWQAIITAACEQSGRNRMPLIYPVSNFSDQIINKIHLGGILLDPRGNMSLKQIACPGMHASLWVGPEGGFHIDELDAAVAAGYSLVNLGPRVLRTETAAVAAISVLQVLQGDL